MIPVVPSVPTATTTAATTSSNNSSNNDRPLGLASDHEHVSRRGFAGAASTQGAAGLGSTSRAAVEKLRLVNQSHFEQHVPSVRMLPAPGTWSRDDDNNNDKNNNNNNDKHNNEKNNKNGAAGLLSTEVVVPAVRSLIRSPMQRPANPRDEGAAAKAALTYAPVENNNINNNNSNNNNGEGQGAKRPGTAGSLRMIPGTRKESNVPLGTRYFSAQAESSSSTTTTSTLSAASSKPPQSLDSSGFKANVLNIGEANHEKKVDRPNTTRVQAVGSGQGMREALSSPAPKASEQTITEKIGIDRNNNLNGLSPGPKGTPGRSNMAPKISHRPIYDKGGKRK